MYVCVYVHTCICMYVCIYMYTCIYIYVSYIYNYVCVCVCVQTAQATYGGKVPDFHQGLMGEKDLYSHQPNQPVNPCATPLVACTSDVKGMSQTWLGLGTQTPALETYVPLCASHTTNLASPISSPKLPRSCKKFPVANFFSPVSGLPPMVEVPVTPYTILRPHRYGPVTG